MRQRHIITVTVAVAAAFLLSAACTTARYVEVPQVKEVVSLRHDTLAVHDSIYVRDSICVVQRGDTVFKEKYKVICRDRWRDRLRVDSFVQRDTVTVIKEVEEPPDAWRQTRKRIGNTAVSIVLLVLGCFVTRLVLRYKRG